MVNTDTVVSRKYYIGESRPPRERDYEAEPYENTPRNLGNEAKAAMPNDDEEYYYNNQLNAPNTWDKP